MSRISPAQQQQLLTAARRAIGAYLRDEHRRGQNTARSPLDCPESLRPESLLDCPETLRQPGASFVTLKIDNRLRGCIGSIEPQLPLLQDVCENAVAAAFRDPRFPALTADEFEQLQIGISLLGEPQDIRFANCEQLARLLQPGIDGLILAADKCRGVFLPQVWESLSEPGEFIRHLKLKAQMPALLEPPELSAQRFEVEHF